MNQKAIVARALSEILKIVGALGIVNVFTLAMMNRAIITHRQEIKSHDGTEPFEHYQIDQQVRDLFDPNIFSIVAGIALLLMFMRFVYGSIILLDGDYVASDAPFLRMRKPDLMSIGALTIIFPVLSFYGGVGKVSIFAVILAIALMLDAAAMHSIDDEDKSRYDGYRKSWKMINSITCLIFFAVFVLLSLAQMNGREVNFEWVGLVLIAIYCGASLFDLWKNRDFYLGLEQVAASAPPGNRVATTTSAAAPLNQP